MLYAKQPLTIISTTTKWFFYFLVGCFGLISVVNAQEALPAPAPETTTVEQPALVETPLVVAPVSLPATEPTAAENSTDGAVAENTDPTESSPPEEKTKTDDSGGDEPPEPLSVVVQPDPTTNTNLPPTTIKQLLPQPNQTTGALMFQYPIIIPPGRNGMQPNVQLTYNSQLNDEDSIFANGWSLPIPTIERINRYGSEKLYATSTPIIFTSSLSDELVQLTTTTYRAKVENGDFLTYTINSSTWTVVDKRGTRYVFGSASTTRQADPADPTRIYKWFLEEMRDRNDNYVTYS